jgi:hypothetical protein
MANSHVCAHITNSAFLDVHVIPRAVSEMMFSATRAYSFGETFRGNKGLFPWLALKSRNPITEAVFSRH